MPREYIIRSVFSGYLNDVQVAVKFKNNIGYTPLHLAAKLGHIRVVEELLAVGANAALKDQVGLRSGCGGVVAGSKYAPFPLATA